MIRVYIFIIALTMMTFSCNLFQDEARKNISTIFFAISPENLLTAIDRNEAKSAFHLLQELPTDIPSNKQVIVNWHESEYLKIINGLYETVLNDSISDWQFTSIGFITKCEYWDVGFQSGYFKLFKIVNNNGKETRFVRSISIYTAEKYIVVADEEYYPKLIDWSPIIMNSKMISAEEALRVSDYAGGDEIRATKNNLCGISVGLTPDAAGYKGWLVTYDEFKTDGSYNQLYKLYVDPYTGAIQ